MGVFGVGNELMGLPILQTTRFASLDANAQNAIRTLFEQCYGESQPLLEVAKKNELLAAPFLAQHRLSLFTASTIYSERLLAIDQATFRYLNETQKKAQEEELYFVFYLLSAHYCLHVYEKRRQELAALAKHIHACALLIYELKTTDPVQKIIGTSDKTLRYLGLTILAPFISDRIYEMTTPSENPSPAFNDLVDKGHIKEYGGAGKATCVQTWLTIINERRLYWVWGGGLLASVLSLLPDSFFYKTQGETLLNLPAPELGYISWILYYTRFGIHLFLLLKHTIKGPWMSEEEKQIPAFERFKNQWQQRKFIILNDAVWASVNLVTFFWLFGNGTLGFWGNALTAGLLVLDVSLNTWQFLEERSHHRQEMKRYDDEIITLKIKGEHLEADELSKIKKTRQIAWRYKQYSLANSVVASIGILISFSLYCCFFFPPAALLPSTVLLMGVAGAALCFAITIISAAIDSGIKIAQTKAQATDVKAAFDALKISYDNEKDPQQKTLICSKINQLLADEKRHHQQIKLQKIRLVRRLLIDALIPPLLFVSFVFLPMGIGLGVIAASFALGVLSNLLINRYEKRMENQKQQPMRFFDVSPSVKNITAASTTSEGLDALTTTSPA